NFVRCIDADTPVHFAWTTIVENYICSLRGVVTAAAASELRPLLASQKRRRHRYRFESGPGNVISTERPADQGPVALIGFELDPGSFVVHLFQAVRRFTVKREHFASLRIQNHYRAMLSF